MPRVDSTTRVERYADAAINGALRDLAGTGPGGRNPALNLAAFRVGQLAAHGIAAHGIVDALEAAGLAMGLPRAEVRSTVRRGLRDGRKRPGRLPDGIADALRGVTPSAAPTARPAPRAEPPPSYPPSDAILALWRACVPVTVDREVIAFLESRGLDVAEIARLDLARAMPVQACPSWARHRHGAESIRSWAATGHRLVVPLYDRTGALRSVIARCILPVPPDGFQKSSGPRGERRGLVMANATARAFLETAAPPLGRTGRQVAIVTEGEIDYLTTAIGPDPDATWHDELAPAVFGMVEGSWADEIAARIPADTHVVIATDPDASGEKYAARIAETLPGRTLHRWEAA